MKINKKKLLKLLYSVEKNLNQLKVFQRNSSCLIALSGGQDSICLALFLYSFKRKFNLKFDIVYCHHAWQKENFFSVQEITKYATYTKTSCFLFLNPQL